MWNDLKKWAADDNIIVKTVGDYMNVIGYFNYYYSKVEDKPEILGMLDKFIGIPVVVLTESQWDNNSLSGTGYLIRHENVSDAKRTYDWFESKPAMKRAYEGTDYMRDYNIYKISQKVKKVPFFLVLREGAEVVISHELAHIIGEKLEIEKSYSNMEAGEYLASESEQFALGHEMRYYKMQGKSFDDYIKETQPVLFRYLEDIKNGKPMSYQERQDAELDRRDYKNIWDKV